MMMPEATVDVNREAGSRQLHRLVRWLRCFGTRDVGPATPAIELEGDQLGELGRDVCHRLFCGAQAASRNEQVTR